MKNIILKKHFAELVHVVYILLTDNSFKKVLFLTSKFIQYRFLEASNVGNVKGLGDYS